MSKSIESDSIKEIYKKRNEQATEFLRTLAISSEIPLRTELASCILSDEHDAAGFFKLLFSRQEALQTKHFAVQID